MERKLRRGGTVWYYDSNGACVARVPSDVYGDLSDVTGDLSGVYGDVDACGLSDEDRERGDVLVDDLIEASK